MPPLRRPLPDPGDARLLGALLRSSGEAAILVGGDGRICGPRTARFDALLPGFAVDGSIITALSARDPELEAALSMGWEALQLPGLPVELTLGALPGRMTIDGQPWSLRFVSVDENSLMEGILVYVEPPQAEAAAEAAAGELREAMAICAAVVDDPDGVLDFLDAARPVILGLVFGGDPRAPAARRDLHSLRRDAEFFGFGAVSGAAAALEQALGWGDSGADALDALGAAWRRLEARVKALRARRREHIELSLDEWIDVQSRIREGEPAESLLDTLYFWGDERAAVRVERLVRQTQAQADRLGKPVEVVGGAGDLRMAAGRFARLWAVLPHLLGNALMHGVESVEERRAQRKATRGLISIRARACRRPLRPALGATWLGCPAPAGESWVRIDVNDDGRGVDFEQVAALAAAAGLPHETSAEQLTALFSDGFSTRAAEDAPVGRGIGTAAVLAEVRRLGGCVEVQSRAGFGCAITLFLPLTDVDQRAGADDPQG